MSSEIQIESVLRRWRNRLFVSIGLMVLPPFVGISGTVIAMVRGFNEASSSNGSDPGKLAGSISASLSSIMLGLVVSLIGLFFFVYCLVRFFSIRQYQKQLQQLPA